MYQSVNDSYFISTDKSKINRDYVHRFLSGSYWTPGISFEKVNRGIEGSMCFAVYEKMNMKQMGFARVITDHTSFAYICDLFIDEAHRGKGLGKWLVEAILVHPDLQGLRRILLATRDAHGLYEKSGFIALPNPERYMVYSPPGK